MKKVLFLMFLLFLMGLGAASVKAQVRIGGDTVPNAAAVLDLNANDTNTGTKGLALPRVSLTNVTTPLTGTPVVNGMMVYNTNATTTGGSGVGIYYWDGSSSKWVKVINSDFTVPISKIVTMPSDSGLLLQSNGSSVVAIAHGTARAPASTASLPYVDAGVASFHKTIDATIPVDLPPNGAVLVPITGVASAIASHMLCVCESYGWIKLAPAYGKDWEMHIWNVSPANVKGNLHFVCFSPTI